MEFSNDHYGLFIILGVIFTSIIIFILTIIHSSSPIRIPVRTSVKLPSKISFEKNADNEYGVGTFVLDVFTIGGHGRLKEAKYCYENQYFLYASEFNKTIDLRLSINNLLNSLGEYTYLIINELEKSQQLLNRPKEKGLNYNQIISFDKASNHIFQLKATTEKKANTGVILLQGSALGGLAAVGSWTLVSLLGTASTGTAIASLSGIAAHNAILAWFGGGALAAGGGGMAAGTLTLGVIVAVPIVIFSAYKTHSKANEIEEQTEALIPEYNKLEQMNQDLVNIEKIIKEQVIILEKQYRKIQEVNHCVNKIIYPNGAFSKVKRSVDEFLNKNFYTKQEADALDQLLIVIDEAFELLSNSHTTTRPQLSISNLI